MTELTHSEIQELLGAYALDAVDGEEYEVVELHLRECPRCRAEVADHREVAALIGHGGATAPEGIWDRIVASIEPAPPALRLELRQPEPEAAPPSAARQAGPVVVPFERPERVPGWNRNLIALAGVAAAVIIVMLGVVLVRVDGGSTGGSENAVTLQRVAEAAWADPDARHADLKGASGQVSAALTPEGEGFLLADDIPELSDERIYQLWGVVGENVISLGTFPADAEVVAFRVDPSVKALAITEEQPGGVVSSENEAVFSAEI